MNHTAADEWNANSDDEMGEMMPWRASSEPDLSSSRTTSSSFEPVTAVGGAWGHPQLLSSGKRVEVPRHVLFDSNSSEQLRNFVALAEQNSQEIRIPGRRVIVDLDSAEFKDSLSRSTLPEIAGIWGRRRPEEDDHQFNDNESQQRYQQHHGPPGSFSQPSHTGASESTQATSPQTDDRAADAGAGDDPDKVYRSRRPCKAKRHRYFKLVDTMMDKITADPNCFDRQTFVLPAAFEANQIYRERFLDRMQLHKEWVLSGGPATGKRSPAAEPLSKKMSL